MTPSTPPTAILKWQKLVARNKTLPFIAAALLVLMLLGLLFMVVVDISNKLTQDSPLAKNGYLDLSHIDFETSEAIPLRGEWQFYWQQLPELTDVNHDLAGQFEIIQVPGTWEQYRFFDEPMSAHGFATFRLRVKVPSDETVLALSLPKISSAFRLYINQRLVDEVGRVSSNAAEAQAGYGPKILTVSAEQGQLDLVLQISNYDFAWGGMWTPITLGSADQQFQQMLSKAIRSISIAGIFFTITVLSLFQFALRASDLLPFIVALSCILLGVRELETSEILYIGQTLQMSFDTAIRVNFLTFYLALPLITMYFHLSYPHEFRSKPILLFCIVGLAFSAMVMFTPPAFFSRSLIVFQCFSLLVLIYAMVGIVLAAYRRRMGARLLCFGSLVLFATASNDIFNSMGLINTGTTAGFGLLSFVLCQNYMTYVRFINDSDERQSLSVKANQDPLTLLLNRRGLMEAIKLDSAEQRQASDHFCVILLDFDHFKVLNDTLGHEAGDEVLAQGSKIMLSAIRKQDLAARWGGEEFVILLPNTECHGAIKLAEKLKQKISVQLSEILQHPITVSLGVAESVEQESFAACLSRADKALYRAKEGGRNRVVVAE